MPLVACLDGARQTVQLLSADDPTVFQRPARSSRAARNAWWPSRNSEPGCALCTSVSPAMR